MKSNIIDLAPYINGTEAAIVEKAEEKEEKKESRITDKIMFGIEAIATAAIGVVAVCGIIIGLAIMLGI